MRHSSMRWSRLWRHLRIDAAVMTDAVVAKRLISNSRWNFIAFAVTVLASFITLPLAIDAIGLGAFGAAGLALALYAPFSLVGTVSGQALVRELAPRLARGDRDGCARITTLTMVAAAAACTVVVLVLWLAGSHFFGSATEPAHSQSEWSTVMLVCGLGWATQQGCLILQSTIAATQNFGRLALATSVGAVGNAVAIVLLSQWMPSALGYLLGTAVGFTFTLLLLFLLVRSDLGWILKPARWNDADVKALSQFGKWQGAAHFVGGVGNQVDRYTLALIAPLAFVGQYNIAMRLQEVVHMGLLKVTEVLFPHFSMTAGDSPARQARFFARSCWLLNIVAVMALAPLVPLAQPLVTLWISADAAVTAGPVLQMLASAGLVGSAVNVYSYFAMASGHSPRLAKIGALHSVALVLSTVLLILAFGPIAAGAGYLLANLLRLALVIHFCGKDFESELSASDMLRHLLLPLAAGTALAWALAPLAPATVSGWLTLAALYALFAGATGVAAVTASTASAAGRHMIRDACRFAKQAIAAHR